MRIVDLFSGAGGLTFGFYYRLWENGFVRNRKNQIIFANEFDDNAAEAFMANYPEINMINCDIRTLTEQQINGLIGDAPVDLIIGGPPCQSYSTVGARCYDDKAMMYTEYSRILNIVRPKMFLFENVKGILSMRETFYKLDENGNIVYEETKNPKKQSKKPRKRPVVEKYGDLIIDKIKSSFSNIEDNFGYNIVYKTLNAVDYGVPESRERVFIIGIRKDLNIKWDFPKPSTTTHISIKEAIDDLPVLGENQNIVNYTRPAQNSYQTLMRKGSARLTQHYCGIYGDKIRTVIKNVQQGQGKEDFNALVDAGVVAEEYRLTSGYANTYGRLIEDQPSPTITNNMTTPSALRCIHYSQNRALSPREGARIQSFPDWFQFSGEKEHVTKQIGNAVPPLLAIAIANQIEKTLKK